MKNDESYFQFLLKSDESHIEILSAYQNIDFFLDGYVNIYLERMEWQEYASDVYHNYSCT